MFSIEEENRQVAFLVQAMLGSISNNVRAIAISFESVVCLHFFIERPSDDDREEFEDIEFEFLALQDGPLAVEHRVTVTSDDLPSVENGRWVYLKKNDGLR